MRVQEAIDHLILYLRYMEHWFQTVPFRMWGGRSRGHAGNAALMGGILPSSMGPATRFGRGVPKLVAATFLGRSIY